SNVTHAMEDVLSLLRQNELKVNAELINTLFEALDLLEVLAQGIAEGREEDIEIAGVLQNLQKFTTQEVTAKQDQSTERRRNLQLRYLPAEIERIKEAANEGLNLNHLHVYLQEECLLKGARAFMILRELEAHGE